MLGVFWGLGLLGWRMEGVDRGVRRLTWPRLIAHARRCKLKAKELAGPAASWTAFTLRPGPKGLTRIYGLGVADPAAGDQTILYADIPSPLPTHNPGLQVVEGVAVGDVPADGIPWAPLMTGLEPNKESGKGLSKEEELRRERMRCTFRGITAFTLNPVHGTLLFQTEAGCFLAADNLQSEVVGSRVTVPGNLAVVDPVACPTQPLLVAFVGSGDVRLSLGSSLARVTNLVGEKEKGPLIHYAGMPSFIIQEEFDRYTGMWWCPRPQNDGSQLLLFEEVDESQVEEIVIGNPGGRVEEQERMRYPLAGSNNATSVFRIAVVRPGPDGKPVLPPAPLQPPKRPGIEALDAVSVLSLPTPLASLFPWAEYVPRAGWLPDGSAVWLEVMSRKQERLQLLHIPVSAFQPASPSSGSMTDLSQNGLSLPTPITVLCEELNPIWVNYNDMLEFLPSSGEGRVDFLWGSERTGFDHYYRVSAALAPPQNPTPVFGPQILSDIVVTKGDWPIKRRIRPVFDHTRKLIYFLGLKDSPIESHIYCVSYERPELGVDRLTELGKSVCAQRTQKNLAIDVEYGIMAVTESNVSTPICGRLYRLRQTPGLPSATPLCLLRPPTPPPRPASPPKPDPLPALPFTIHDHSTPRILSYTGKRTGMEHYAMVFTPPPSFPVKKKHPVVLYVYGGPEVQLVQNQWSSSMGMLKYTALGYAVVMLDGRGSANRGLRWEGLVKHAMGQEETGDQVEGLEAVAASTGDLLDLSRVAVAGWSYGGFLSLWSLIHRPDVFKVAMAGGPVTDYALYDTGYTERYMDSPTAQPLAYRAASVVAAAHRLPEEKGRLLLLHGVMDENVHLKHTLKLLHRLDEIGRPYDLQLFPGERHGIRFPSSPSLHPSLQAPPSPSTPSAPSRWEPCRATGAADHLDAAQLHYLSSNL